MSDEERIAYLAGDGDAAPPDDRAGLDELRDLLADPTLWAEPPAGLEDRVAAAIAAEATAGAGAGAAAPVLPTVARGRRTPVAWRLLGVAAALLLVVGVAASVARRSSGGGGERLSMALAAPAGAPAATGTATLRRTDSGWRIELDATGLARLDGGRFYQAWLRDAAGTLVPIGTFNEGADVVLWAGVSPRDFPTLTVTEEVADGNQSSSGKRVLAGTISG
jgi:Anti-sigma-K factor rskA